MTSADGSPSGTILGKVDTLGQAFFLKSPSNGGDVFMGKTCNIYKSLK